MDKRSTTPPILANTVVDNMLVCAPGLVVVRHTWKASTRCCKVKPGQAINSTKEVCSHNPTPHPSKSFVPPLC